MRIAILGDTHMPKGSRALPARCRELIAASDLVVHTGDFTRLEALELVAGIGPPLVAVHGNVDEPAIVERLPETVAFDAEPGFRLAVVHDGGPSHGRLARLRRRFPDAAAVVFGHSHMPLHERSPEGGFEIFNPGSPTERRRAPTRSMGTAEVNGGSIAFRHVDLG